MLPRRRDGIVDWNEMGICDSVDGGGRVNTRLRQMLGGLYMQLTEPYVQ